VYLFNAYKNINNIIQKLVKELLKYNTKLGANSKL